MSNDKMRIMVTNYDNYQWYRESVKWKYERSTRGCL
jgi:hypothetical protein